MDRINKVILLGWSVLIGCLLVAYITISALGEVPISFVIILALLFLVPYLFGLVLYQKDSNTKWYAYICGYGFLLGYTYMLFSLKNSLIFVYFLPMLSLLIITNNARFLSAVSVLCILVNVISIATKIKSASELSSAITETALLQIVNLTLACVIASIAVRINTKLNKEKIQKLKHNEETQLKLNDQITKLVENAEIETKKIYNEIETFKKTIDETVLNMQQVSEGSTSIAYAVQDQLVVSNDIKSEIENTEQCVETSQNNIITVNNIINRGKSSVQSLNQHSEEVTNTSNKLKEKALSLKAITEQQRDIIRLISEIASQTNLLALNASIEAARAGTAGTGFSVVASSITDLATQTKNAITNIDEMVSSLQEEMDSMTSEVNHMDHAINEQTSLIDDISNQFDSINQSLLSVSAMSDQVSEKVSCVSTKNTSLVSNVSTLSAVSEEISACAQETLACATDNLEIAADILGAVDSLKAQLSSIH